MSAIEAFLVSNVHEVWRENDNISYVSGPL
jgi:hypothetical protein